MTTDELERATKQFDESFVVDKSRPLTAQEQKQWREAKRRKGRPKVGAGFKRISIKLERGLLKRATALAKKRCISRSELISMGIEEVLASKKG